MNKTELIDDIATRTDGQISKKDIGAVVTALIDAVSGSLTKGDPVTLIGFGTFKTSKRSARTGRNPRTGEEIQIAERLSPAFVAGKSLKDAINK